MLCIEPRKCFKSYTYNTLMGNGDTNNNFLNYK